MLEINKKILQKLSIAFQNFSVWPGTYVTEFDV